MDGQRARGHAVQWPAWSSLHLRRVKSAGIHVRARSFDRSPLRHLNCDVVELPHLICAIQNNVHLPLPSDSLPLTGRVALLCPFLTLYPSEVAQVAVASFLLPPARPLRSWGQ